ncbi:MAG: M24 family metallopeptidase [Xanthomonadales bacterium]|nr:M24 family metallopeptidase [Xanthomonadales bacterium]
MKSLLILVMMAVTVPAATAADYEQGRVVDTTPSILAPRDRVDVINRILLDRLDNLLPRLMREAGIDMWLVINREYNEDPAYMSLVPEPVFAARRTTMLVFFDRGPGEGVERFTVSRYPIKGAYDSVWEGGNLEEQWQRLAEVIEERNPKKIGINKSMTWPVADGLSAALHEELLNSLSPSRKETVVSAEKLVVRWLETRSEMELQVYPQVVGIARSVISEAFSNKVITPGVTMPSEVAWYIRERFESLGLKPWFQPYVNVQRQGSPDDPESPFFGANDIAIQPGDVLHTDVGICYLRLCTDTQEMGYVLRMGEADVPQGLKDALAVGNRWQDLLTGEFKTGRPGNDILARTRKAQEKEGIVGSVYTHPLGAFGHAPGPTIGMWDNQGPTPDRGDWPLYPNTGYAIEGNIKTTVPEWDDQMVQIKLEQSAVYDGSKVYYLAGRQTEWHIVR